MHMLDMRSLNVIVHGHGRLEGPAIALRADDDLYSIERGRRELVRPVQHVSVPNERANIRTDESTERDTHVSAYR